MSIQDIGVIASVVLSLISLGIVIYKEFLQGFKLHSNIDQVILMRVGGANRAVLITEILLDDLLSNHPSRQAIAVTIQDAEIQQTIASMNRDKLRIQIVELSNRTTIQYNPPSQLIEKYVSDKRFATSFFIPLVVFNSGRKYAHISSLVLIAKLRSDQSRKWAFSALIEIDSLKLLQRNQMFRDADLIAGWFVGLGIGPGERVQINPWLTPITDANNRIISRESIIPGEYSLTVLGYGPDGKRILQTKTINFTLTKELLVDAFLGGETATNVNVEKHIDDAVNFN